MRGKLIFAHGDVMVMINKKIYKCLLNFKGNSDIERYQMANKKIPFKYARPVEEWLQEKGNFEPKCFYAYVCSLYWYDVKNLMIKRIHSGFLDISFFLWYFNLDDTTLMQVIHIHINFLLKLSGQIHAFHF